MVNYKHVSNHYETLKVSPSASQADIKQAYRRLVKLFHPDSNQETADHEQIIRINAAYEVLGDNHNRRNYDQQLQDDAQKNLNSDRQQRTASAQKHYQTKRKTGREADEQVEEWLRRVYQPVNHLLDGILYSLEEQIEQLAADPFDDELLDEFQEYYKPVEMTSNRHKLLFDLC